MDAQQHILIFCLAMAAITCLPLLGMLLLPTKWTGIKFEEDDDAED